VCAPATADDGVKNEGETDTDCGGPGAGVPRCGTGMACLVAGDCVDGVCAGGKCAAPTATDGVKNGDESDVDCGGVVTKAPKCAVGKTCKIHADCTTDGCDETGRCALGRSCTLVNGGSTCGSGEFESATKKHESCCVALPIPGMPGKLDKYKITAGRMRAFVDRVKGDVAGWYAKNRASLSDTVRAQIDPFVEYLPTIPYGVNHQLGGYVYLPKMPSEQQGCWVGNAANPGYGAHTFDNGTAEGDSRGFDRDFLDRLPLNCVTYPMIAAFCAWDGGHVMTYPEHVAAYGPGSYPSGVQEAVDKTGKLPGGWRDLTATGGGYTIVGPATTDFSMTPCPTCDITLLNWSNSYEHPINGKLGKPWDYAYFISPPGRFPLDHGPNGHMDIGGVLMEITATPEGTETTPDYTGVMVTQPRVYWSKNGSWEGHAVNFPYWFYPVMTKYGKTGGRCARD
jgi:hypothetical protein